MTGLQRVACLIGLAAALFLSASGCADYTYFNVDIAICSEEYPPAPNWPADKCPSDKRMVRSATSSSQLALDNIGDCFVYVTDAASGKNIEDPKELVTTADSRKGMQACNLGKTPTHIGVMDYSTAQSGGTLRFLVSMVDTQGTEHTTIADGSVDGPVKGGIISLQLVAIECGGTSGSACVTAPSSH